MKKQEFHIQYLLLYNSVPINFWPELDKVVISGVELEDEPLFDAFTWSKSPQGWDFWNKVNRYGK